jgi:hypothetical protein
MNIVHAIVIVMLATAGANVCASLAHQIAELDARVEFASNEASQ